MATTRANKRPSERGLQQFQVEKKLKSTTELVLQAEAHQLATLSIGECLSPGPSSTSQVIEDSSSANQNEAEKTVEDSSTTAVTAVPSSKPVASSDRAWFCNIAQYRLLKPVDDGSTKTYHCVNTETNEKRICKIISLQNYELIKSVVRRVESCGLNDERRKIMERIVPSTSKFVFGCNARGERQCFWFLPLQFGDLHSKVRDNKGLLEHEIRSIFRQVVEMVELCHQCGILLRDLKLRKLVFTDEQKTQVRLESVDAIVVCPDLSDDNLHERHGCPAYVSPELLVSGRPRYSGKAADIWSLGILLFVMIFGRYPFYDTSPVNLFTKIRSHPLVVPDRGARGWKVSILLSSLLKGILRKSPAERPLASELLNHRWVTPRRCYGYGFDGCSIELFPSVRPDKATFLAQLMREQISEGDEEGTQMVPWRNPSNSNPVSATLGGGRRVQGDQDTTVEIVSMAENVPICRQDSASNLTIYAQELQQPHKKDVSTSTADLTFVAGVTVRSSS